MEVDGTGQPGVALQVVDQGLDRLVSFGDQGLDDRRFAEADAPRLAELPGEDLVEIGDQRRNPRILVAALGRLRRSFRLARPALVVGQQFGKLLEEVDIGRGHLAAVDELPGVGKAHRRGRCLHGCLQGGQGPCVRQGDRIVAAHVGADGAVEVVPGQVIGHRHVAHAVVGQIDRRFSHLLARPSRHRGPEALGEIGAAGPQEQRHLDRMHALQRHRVRLGDSVIGSESAKRRGRFGPRLFLDVLPLVTGRGFEHLDVCLQIGRHADGNGRVDQSAPGDGEPSRLAGPCGQDPAVSGGDTGDVGPDAADGDLDCPVIAPRGSARPCSKSVVEALTRNRGNDVSGGVHGCFCRGGSGIVDPSNRGAGRNFFSGALPETATAAAPCPGNTPRYAGEFAVRFSWRSPC